MTFSISILWTEKIENPQVAKKKKVLVSSLKSLYVSWRDSYHKTRSSGCVHQLCLFGDSYIAKFCVIAALVSKWVAFPQEPNLFLLGHALVTSTWLPARRKKLLNQNLTDDSWESQEVSIPPKSPAWEWGRVDFPEEIWNIISIL